MGKGEIACPFPTGFSKGLFPRGVTRCHCVGNYYQDCTSPRKIYPTTNPHSGCLLVLATARRLPWVNHVLPGGNAHFMYVVIVSLSLVTILFTCESKASLSLKFCPAIEDMRYPAVNKREMNLNNIL